MIVSLAPSFLANYENVSFASLKEALKKLGFYDVEETAIGATIVKKSYDEILENNNRDIIITSCCHSINLLIEKHYPELLPFLADTMSPMVAHEFRDKSEVDKYGKEALEKSITSAIKPLID